MQLAFSCPIATYSPKVVDGVVTCVFLQSIGCVCRNNNCEGTRLVEVNFPLCIDEQVRYQS